MNSDINMVRAIRLDGVRILIADDCSDNQKLFQRILTAAGASVEGALNGELAVQMEHEGDYDVIIMDICMPILDGHGATRAIRAGGFAGPIIALTAHDTDGEDQRCLASGCSHFYLKPIDRLGLLRAVAEAVVQAQAR